MSGAQGLIESSATSDWVSPSVGQWANKELELFQQHEQLLKRREALLRTTECYYDFKRQQADSFVTNFHTANARNESLRRELNERLEDLHSRSVTDKRFNLLKNNYWVMVNQVFPLWLQDQQEYEHQINSNNPGRHSVTTSQQNVFNSNRNNAASSLATEPKPSHQSPTRSVKTRTITKQDTPTVRFSADSIDKSENVSQRATDENKNSDSQAVVPARRNSEQGRSSKQTGQVRQTDYSVTSSRSRSASIGSGQQTNMLEFK